MASHKRLLLTQHGRTRTGYVNTIRLPRPTRIIKWKRAIESAGAASVSQYAIFGLLRACDFVITVLITVASLNGRNLLSDSGVDVRVYSLSGAISLSDSASACCVFVLITTSTYNTSVVRPS